MINIDNWGEFAIGELFDIVKGSRLTKANQIDGSINFVSASSFNNGITAHIANDNKVHPGETLTVSYNGSDIGRTFYQELPFWASDDVNVLYPKFKINKEIGLFIAPIIKEVGGRHVYKDKWKKEEMEQDIIYLPVTPDGTPDWEYMEKYIRKLEKRAAKTIEDYCSLL